MSDQTPPTTDDGALSRTIGFSVAKLISETSPLRGKEAAVSMQLHLSKMSNQAGEEGLTEEAVMNMIEERD